jgi:hypothetical protein
MSKSVIGRTAVLAALALSTSACATSSDVFARHESDMQRRASEEANADRWLCPVLVSNSTDDHLEVEYEAAGIRSALGILPAGQQVRFGVFCDAEQVDAHGVSTMGGLYGDGIEYRTSARLDRTKPAVLHFTRTHAVR